MHQITDRRNATGGGANLATKEQQCISNDVGQPPADVGSRCAAAPFRCANERYVIIVAEWSAWGARSVSPVPLWTVMTSIYSLWCARHVWKLTVYNLAILVISAVLCLLRITTTTLYIYKQFYIAFESSAHLFWAKYGKLIFFIWLNYTDSFRKYIYRGYCCTTSAGTRTDRICSGT